MELYYYKAAGGNFGDDLNPWLWPRLVPGLLAAEREGLFIGIGTILDERIPPAPSYRVFGAGVGYGALPSRDERWTFYCVRGPLSAKALGLDPRCAISDPALLAGTLPLPEVSKQYRISFIPHHESVKWATYAGVSLWSLGCRLTGVHYIDPREDVEHVLRDIQRSKLVLTEAMHGAILADAFRVPWIPVKFHDHILDLKWKDWCASMDLEYEPQLPRQLLTTAPPRATSLRRRLWRKIAPVLFASDLRRLERTAEPMLSSDRVLNRATTRLQEALEKLQRDVSV